jgi:hypothetical protein
MKAPLTTKIVIDFYCHEVDIYKTAGKRHSVKAVKLTERFIKAIEQARHDAQLKINSIGISYIELEPNVRTFDLAMEERRFRNELRNLHNSTGIYSTGHYHNLSDPDYANNYGNRGK